VNVKGWAAIVADIEAGREGPWGCPENTDGQVEVRAIEGDAGIIVEWHLKCHTCGAETYVRRGPAKRC